MATISSRTQFGRRQDTTLDCPCPQNIHVLVQFTAKATNSPGTRHRPRTRFVRVHEQAATMFSPHQWPRPRTLHVCGQAKTRTILEQVNGTGHKFSADSPQSPETVRVNQGRDCVSQFVASTCRFDRARLTPASWQSFESAKQSRINRKCPGKCRSNVRSHGQSVSSPRPQVCPQLFRAASASTICPWAVRIRVLAISRVISQPPGCDTSRVNP